MIWLAVALGGALGALLRHAVASWLGPHEPDAFPWSTWAVNIAGCLAIGLILAVLERARFGDSARAFLVTGLLGSFTTFSTFGHETWCLIERGRLGTAGLYLATSLVVGLAAVGAGRALAG